jgi:hypothetical protein
MLRKFAVRLSGAFDGRGQSVRRPAQPVSSNWNQVVGWRREAGRSDPLDQAQGYLGLPCLMQQIVPFQAGRQAGGFLPESSDPVCEAALNRLFGLSSIGALTTTQR